MDAIFAAWHVLQLHAEHIIVFAVFVVVGGVLILGLLPKTITRDLTGADYVSLASSLWVLPALLFSALALLLTRWVGREWMGWLLAIVAVVAVALLAWRRAGPSLAAFRPKPAETGILLAALLGLAFLRLVFVEGLLLPQYFDSATHYGLIQQLAHWAERSDSGRGIVLPVTPYYHVGYHLLLAGLLRVTQLDTAAFMLVSGQLALALMPFALFALAHRFSGSSLAAWVAVAFAAAGWYMPAFASNWGKYPALLGFLPTVGALTLALMAVESAQADASTKRLWVLSLAMTASAGSIHTRYLLVIAAAVLAYAASHRLWSLPARWRNAVAALVVLCLVVLATAVWRDPALRPALEPYAGSGLWPTIGVGLLAFAALAYRPRQVLAVCIFLACLLAGLMLPAPWAGLGSILDRPLVEMLIFAPLSILGGLGFASIAPRLGAPGSKLAAATLAAALLVHALAAYDLRASACCTIFTQDDAVAIEWLDGSAGPSDAVVIATETLQLGRTPTATLIAPADAGAWIGPLTSLATLGVDSSMDLREPALLDSLCESGARYVYVGGSGRGFDLSALQTQSSQFTTRLQLPRAAVLEIVGCGG